MAGEFGEDLRAANPFLEHLRGSFDEIGFHGDTADTGPLLLTTEDVVHEVTEFMEESFDVAVIHEAGIGGGGHGEVADEDSFGQLFAADAVEHRRHFGVAVFAGARMHVEIEAADGLAAVDDDPGFDGGIPRGNILFLLEADVEEVRGGVEDSLLHLHEREVRADGLRVEVILAATH